MGIDLISQALALPRGTVPDWDRAGAWIGSMPVDQVIDTGDEFFPVESWEELAELDGVTFEEMATDELWDKASHVRAAIEDPDRSGLMTIELPDHTVYVAAEPNGGEEPSQLLDDLILFGEAGIAWAARFTSWTDYCEPSLAERLAPDGLRMPADAEGPVVRSDGRVSPLHDAADWIAWLASESLDWAQARRHLGGQDDLLCDLADLQAQLEELSIRMLARERIGDVDLWLIGDHGAFGEGTVARLSRLTEAGVAEPLGLLGFGLPPRDD